MKEGKVRQLVVFVVRSPATSGISCNKWGGQDKYYDENDAFKNISQGYEAKSSKNSNETLKI